MILEIFSNLKDSMTSISEKDPKNISSPENKWKYDRGRSDIILYLCQLWPRCWNDKSTKNIYEKVIPHYIYIFGKRMQKRFFILYQDIQHCYCQLNHLQFRLYHHLEAPCKKKKKKNLSIKKNLLINLLTNRFFKKAFTVLTKIFQYYAEERLHVSDQ